jgi:DNA-binding transcriptional LysR family regulator
MDTEALRVFIDVTRRGSFAAVARDRDVDPSSVSRVIAGLEKELGVRLFQRTTRQLCPTEAGTRYFARMEPLLEEMERARDDATEVNSIPKGTLRLTTTVSFGQICVVPLLPILRTTLPELKIELILSDDNLDLIAERIDLAIRLSPPLADTGLIGTKFIDTHYRVCASPAYLESEGSLHEPIELSSRRCVLFALPQYRTRWLFRHRTEEIVEVPVDGDILSTNAVSLRDCVRAGMGPALLADWLVGEDLRAGRLVDLFPDHEVTATEFETAAWLLYPSRSFLPLKVRAVIDFLRAQLPQSLHGLFDAR